MIVHDTTLLRLKSAFQQYRGPAGEFPSEVTVRQTVAEPDALEVTLAYSDHNEVLRVS